MIVKVFFLNTTFSVNIKIYENETCIKNNNKNHVHIGAKRIGGFVMKRKFVLCLLLILLISSQGFSKNKKQQKENKDSYWLKSYHYSGLSFRNIGPSFMSGRLSDIAVHPVKKSTWYITAGSGGVWKSENAGISWKPIFDKYPSYSIACITIDPVNPDTLWLGTGENVSGRHVGYGDGVYKSTDGGKHWKNVGLKESEHIGKIIVNPKHSNIVFVASEGPLWSKGGERGVFKTEDGGMTWKNVLKISENTGVTDIEFDSTNPDIIYAAAYMRRRSVSSFLGGGPESGIYKTVDGGKTWKKLSRGLPHGDVGKIGLAVSTIKPEVVYATIEASDKSKGFYRSENRGMSWEKRSGYVSGGTGPHYYQEIYADPNIFDRVYQMDVYMKVTEDGGKTFKPVGEKNKHVDNHALAIDKSDSDHLLAGCDGGLYESFDRGKSWRFFTNLPLTQFYKLSLDNSYPFYNIHGGAQDNSSQLGPSRTLNANGIVNSDWIITSGADGYSSAIQKNNNIIFCTWQNGSIQRYDKKSGQLINIKPQSEDPKETLRWNWDSPLFISPHKDARIYIGGNKLFKSEDNGDSWKCISPDLTRNIFRLDKPIMDKTWSIDSLWDHMAMSTYSTLTALSESSLKEGMIVSGSDDGLINLTENTGKSWKKLKLNKSIPEFCFVNDIKLSMHHENVIYAALDNHKTGDFKPYIIKSEDKGNSWKIISGNLPKRMTVWAIEEDHVKENLIFIGTEFGIYFTLDNGKHWNKLSSGVPTVPFRDIEIQRRENDLVCASFGRGFFILDDYSPLREISEEKLKNSDGLIFPIKKAFSYIERRPIGSSGKGKRGASFFTAKNPSFGAIITYYLKDSDKTKKQLRKKKESKLKKEKKDIPFPGWDKLKEESQEERSEVYILIKDGSGQIIKKIKCSGGKGMHRVAWDLRYQSTYPIRKSKNSRWKPTGPMVIPGKFSATLVKRNESGVNVLSSPVEFEVESLNFSTLSEINKTKLLAYQKKASELQRVMMGTLGVIRELKSKVKSFENAAKSSSCSCENILLNIKKVKKYLEDINEKLFGDRIKSKYDEPTPLSLIRRLNLHLYSTSNLTENTTKNYDFVKTTFGEIYNQVKKISEVYLPSIEKELEKMKVPWSEGRGLPDFNSDEL